MKQCSFGRKSLVYGRFDTPSNTQKAQKINLFYRKGILPELLIWLMERGKDLRKKIKLF